jgi:cytoskeletal protein CcmA (bactofilin family)
LIVFGLIPRGDQPSKLKSLDGVVAAGCVVNGEVLFAGGLRVDGTINGAVKGQPGNSLLVVGHGAAIVGPIDVEHLVVSGCVRGSIRAMTAELLPSARVEGELNYGTLEAHAGAGVNGALTVLTPKLLDMQAESLGAADALHERR